LLNDWGNKANVLGELKNRLSYHKPLYAKPATDSICALDPAIRFPGPVKQLLEKISVELQLDSAK
jgi:hypothetical protein